MGFLFFSTLSWNNQLSITLGDCKVRTQFFEAKSYLGLTENLSSRKEIWHVLWAVDNHNEYFYVVRPLSSPLLNVILCAKYIRYYRPIYAPIKMHSYIWIQVASFSFFILFSLLFSLLFSRIFFFDIEKRNRSFLPPPLNVTSYV